ncbi:MAG: hypothetical protein HUJ90_02765, partial [Bacteroidales bacterium]|nr:hypothetical protein [Bacteroidales bacterium]
MKKILSSFIAVVAFMALYAPASAQEKVDPKYVDLCSIDSITYAGITRQYALYQPKNENGEVKKNLPLVIWNHGGGEYNIPIRRSLLANRGVVAWPEEGFECAVLMIQVANENYSYMAALDEEKMKLIDRNNALQVEIVRRLIEKGEVDPSRVYVTGASSGGGAT